MTFSSFLSTLGYEHVLLMEPFFVLICFMVFSSRWGYRDFFNSVDTSDDPVASLDVIMAPYVGVYIVSTSRIL